MISFLLAFSSDIGAPVACMDQAAARIAENLPGHELDIVRPADTGIHVLLVREAGDARAGLVSVASQGNIFVVLYGEQDAPESGTTLAQAVADAAQADMGAALAQVAGCYGGAIVDRARGEVHLVSDGLGQRTMRYARSPGLLLASPHDLMLVAAGVPVSPDPLALAGMIRFGWSFGGGSLLEAVEAVAAEEVHILRGDALEVRHHPAHLQAAHREGTDTQGVRAAVLDDLIRYVRDNHRAGTPLDVELSAGFDSRAVLTIALAAAPGDVTTFTDGPPASQDVRVATRIASALSLPHRAGGVGASTAEERLAAIDTLAIATNGQATAMPIMTNKGAKADPGHDSLGGDGGEVFRGYYYPKVGTLAAKAYDPAALSAFAMDKFSVGAGLLPEALERSLATHVHDRLARWSPLCRSNADGFDLLYLIERTGTWNQKLRRVHGHRSNPFYSRSATYAFLSMPGVRGRRARIHEALFHTHPWRLRLIPLNGETIPALMAGGAVSRALSRGVTLAAKIGWKVADRFLRGRAGTGSGDLEEIRARNFQAHLAQDWSDLFSGEQSVFRRLVGAATADRILAQAHAGKRSAGDVLGTMVVVERFFRIAAAVSGTSPLPKSDNGPI